MVLLYALLLAVIIERTILGGSVVVNAGVWADVEERLSVRDGCSPIATGQHALTVRFKGVHVAGSPLIFTVMPRHSAANQPTAVEQMQISTTTATLIA